MPGSPHVLPLPIVPSSTAAGSTPGPTPSPTATATATATSTPAPTPTFAVRPGDVRVVCIGKLGVDAVNALLYHPQLAGADFYCLDTDAQMLAARAQCPRSNHLVLDPAQPTLSPETIHRLTAKSRDVASFEYRQIVAMLPSRLGARQGILYLVGGAGSASPAVLDQLVALAREGTAAGRVVVAALAQPLSFEGPRRVRSAQQFVTGLTAEGGADLVALVNQDVLMTMPGSQVGYI